MGKSQNGDILTERSTNEKYLEMMMHEQIDALLEGHGRDVVSVATIIVVGTILFLIARRGLGLLLSRGVAEPLIRMFRIMLRWTFVSVVLLLVLQELGILENAWSALLAVSAMIAIGFIAVWSVLSNMLSTLLILIYKPFRIGDSIEIPADNLAGIVEDLNLMFTSLRAEDGFLIEIPNNQFFQKAIRRTEGNGQVTLLEQFAKRKDVK